MIGNHDTNSYYLFITGQNNHLKYRNEIVNINKLEIQVLVPFSEGIEFKLGFSVRRFNMVTHISFVTVYLFYRLSVDNKLKYVLLHPTKLAVQSTEIVLYSISLNIDSRPGSLLT